MVYDWLRAGSYSHFGWLKPAKVWRLYTTLSGLFLIAAAFALALQAGAGGGPPVVSIDGPPEGPAFEFRQGRGAPPTMRVPLSSGKFDFVLPWHIQIGGCERVVTRTFSRGEPGYDAYSLTQQLVGKPYPVGRPMRDRIEVTLPRGIEPGLWRYRSTGDVQNCPIPRKSEPVTYAEFFIEVF